MVRFGVGKNMVTSMRHWGLSLGMLKEACVDRKTRGRTLAVTALGASLFRDSGWDPFLEDPGTLWLLHWKLAGHPDRATTWWWVFNHYPSTEFTRQDLQQALESLVAQNEHSRVTSASLKRDIEVFVRTYAPSRRSQVIEEDTLDSPLAELGLVRESSSVKTYRLMRAPHNTLPTAVFAYALAGGDVVHILVSEGGLREDGTQWRARARLDRKALMPMWRYAVITLLREAARDGVLDTDMARSALRRLLTAQYERWWNIERQAVPKQEAVPRLCGPVRPPEPSSTTLHCNRLIRNIPETGYPLDSGNPNI